jgi:hypothetical protein
MREGSARDQGAGPSPNAFHAPCMRLRPCTMPRQPAPWHAIPASAHQGLRAAFAAPRESGSIRPRPPPAALPRLHRQPCMDGAGSRTGQRRCPPSWALRCQRNRIPRLRRHPVRSLTSDAWMLVADLLDPCWRPLPGSPSALPLRTTGISYAGSGMRPAAAGHHLGRNLWDRRHLPRFRRLHGG